MGEKLVIARIMHGGLIHRQGLLKVGDVVKEVNGEVVSSMQPVELQAMLVRFLHVWLEGCESFICVAYSSVHVEIYYVLLSLLFFLHSPFSSIAWQLWFPSDQGGALSSGGSWTDRGLPQNSLWLQSSPGSPDPFSGCWTWLQERRHPHGAQPGGQLLVAGNYSRVHLGFEFGGWGMGGGGGGGWGWRLSVRK